MSDSPIQLRCASCGCAENATAWIAYEQANTGGERMTFEIGFCEMHSRQFQTAYNHSWSLEEDGVTVKKEKEKPLEDNK